ncbi:MAG TPA: hypothetical protein VHB68_11960, partial [Steroidobacteraceae bacterium]|nr:hypothetical protein [Steroidobacteraceae bacterium]
MRLSILLPFGTFAVIDDVTRIVVTTPGGCFGILPRRLDCATLISPGLLTYSTLAGDSTTVSDSTTAGDESHVAVDAGVMIKTGTEVQVCVRHAVAGAHLGRLHEAVDRELTTLSAQARAARVSLAEMESTFIRRFLE